MWKYLRLKKKKKMMMLLLLLFLLFGMSTTVSVSNNNNNNVSLLENCCQQNDLPQSCSGSCFEVALSNNGNIHALHNSCSSSLVEFWRCVQSYVAGFANSSSSSSSSASSASLSSSSSSSSTSEWSGRSCCELSLTSHCKNACLKAKSDHEIESHCNRADGSAVYKCLGKYRDGQRCCKSSSTDQCHASCKALFIQDTPPDTNQVQLAVNQCNDPVAECILVSFPTSPNNLPPRNIECCDHGSKESCSRECREVLGSSLSEEEMVESLTKSCGTPNPADPMWQCFLVKSAKDRSGSSVVDVVGGMDAVKLQCCQRAQRGKCRDLCEKTFGRGWSDSISEFHQVCTNNVQESALNTCLDEAEDRCQLGCSNLTYCTNFNYRPTELFRKCSSGPDQEARKTFRSWKEGVISLPSIFNFDIPVKDVTKCYPEKWHVVACSLHIKPCRSGGGSWICKRDCLDILSTCIDRKRMAVAFSIREICDLLSPTDNPDECISVGSYLTEGHHKSSQQEVTTPCNPNPCGSKDVCLVNRQPCRHSRVFQSHTKNKHKFNAFRLDRIDHVFDDDYRNVCPVQSCKPGCPMGEMVSQLVAPGSLVRLNDPTNQACFKLCQCGYYGNWDNCSKTCNEDGRHQRQCLHSSGMIHDHGTGFSVGCNTCVCNNGESVCTLKFCRMLSFQPAPPYVSYVVPSALVVAGPPCNCTYLYKPVCASNGQTFPNLCLARCHKFETSQLQAGSCQSVDPCSLNPCLSGERCIKNPQICFGGSLLPQNMCPQHKCIKLSSCNPTSSSSSSSTSYCDVTQSRDYNSLCEAAKNNSTNVCSKHCSVGCKVHGKVCAVDGVTYSSECAARCNNVPVDYYSPCNSVAQYHNVTSKVICPRVNCPKRTWTPGCIPTIPPGSCCPICASEIRCLVSHRQALTMSQHHGAITISGLVSTLEALLSVKECTIHAYFSIEAELVLLVAPSNQNPSAVQVEACTKEASHLSSLISTKSPTITSYAQTSILLTADLRNTKRVFMYYSATTSLRPSPPLLLFLSTTVMMMLVVVVSSWPSFRQDLSHTTMS